GGKVRVAFDLGGDKSDVANAIAIQADGKIVLAGSAVVAADNRDFAVARLNPNGTLDTTFSGDGRATVGFNLGARKEDGANAIAIQADGKIVLAGSAAREDGNNQYDFAVARLNASGTLDTTFSGDGRATADFGAGSDVAYALAIQADGKIVPVG